MKKSHDTNPILDSIPPSVVHRLEEEMRGVGFGAVSLIVNIRDGRPSFRIEKVLSFLPWDEGGGHG